MPKPPKKIGEFTLYEKSPNTITSGYLYTAVKRLPFALSERNRTLRVWLPHDYFTNNKKNYPVLYMFDGQNLVDEKTSGFGEWNMEDHVTALMKEKKISGLIIVGLDCPHEKTGKDRLSEYCPYKFKEYKDPLFKDLESPYGDKTASYLFKKIKPLIDDTFRTLPDKANTGVGGSSMGGLMSFYCAITFKRIIGFCLSFSPAFMVPTSKDLDGILEKWNPNPKDYGKFVFYVGGKDFEAEFVKPTFKVLNYMEKKKFNDTQVAFIHDSLLIHHESAWTRFVQDALLFWLQKEEKEK